MFRPIKANSFYIVTDSFNTLAFLDLSQHHTSTSPQNNILEQLTSIFFHILHSPYSPPTLIQYTRCLSLRHPPDPK
ncbi:hypothetical protein CMEL01_04644 [Colletotrichum melonis]|uniref:Uncharacterized protein n=1 Tax=Colletotrichum melonis TaxID=1209925 RepID=A0AAI9UCQ8_9PEZI|nr:hypothetical protein CMEL01_04644 [Colletotrichum melonis]